MASIQRAFRRASNTVSGLLRLGITDAGKRICLQFSTLEIGFVSECGKED